MVLLSFSQVKWLIPSGTFYPSTLLGAVKPRTKLLEPGRVNQQPGQTLAYSVMSRRKLIRVNV